MSFVRVSGLLGLVALGLVAGPYAAAQDSGWYLGGNVGQAKAKIDDPRITQSLLEGGFTTLSMADRDDDTGFKVFGGYQFNKYLALEGGYFDLGKFGFTAITAPAGSLTGDSKVRGWDFDVVGTLPITTRFSLFARVGAVRAEAKDTFSSTGFVTVLRPNPSKGEVNVKFGGGLQYDFTRHVAARLEAESYRVNDAVGNRGDINLLSLGLLVRFGRKATPSTPMAEPVPVAVVQPVQPVPEAIMAPPVKTEVYCSVLDIQFEVDKDEIQREEKEKLAVVGTFLTKYPETTVVIEGHSDTVGTPEHNLALSQRRAESVVAYLVNDLHIAASRMKAVGYGSTRPIADNATEEGKRANRRIDAVITCATDIEGLTVKPARVTMAMVIEFDQNKAEIRPEYGADLRKVAKFLNANPRVKATVEGHTGNLQANAEQAMVISQLRAQNVVDFLVEKCGIDRSRLTARGFGQTRRYAYNTEEEGKQDNRRVNIIIDYPKQ